DVRAWPWFAPGRLGRFPRAHGDGNEVGRSELVLASSRRRDQQAIAVDAKAEVAFARGDEPVRAESTAGGNDRVAQPGFVGRSGGGARRHHAPCYRPGQAATGRASIAGSSSSRTT